MAAQNITGEQLNLLWRGFQLKGVDDDLPKKARIAKTFKGLLEVAQVYAPDASGSLVAQDDPRGAKTFPESAMVEFEKGDAEYLGECLKEVCKHKEQGKPAVTAAQADDVQHLTDVLLPNWKATVPETVEEVAS